MIGFNTKTLTLTALLAGTMLGLGACQQQGTTPSDTAGGDDTEASTELPGEGQTVQSAHSTLLEEKFQTLIVDTAMEELGYEVEDPQEIEYATMHVAIANNDIQYSPVHWEKLHSDFYEESGGDEELERVGLVVPNLLQGYLIDKATADEYDITTLDQLQDPEIAALFDSDGNGQANLTGCNPGWGCELVIEHHLDVYDLSETVEHDQGQYSALVADTITRYEQGEPILYYTWTPLWVSNVLKPGEDVVWLEVPETNLPEEQGEMSAEDTTYEGKNLGFAVDQMRVVANQEFIDENPAAERLFEEVQIPREDISAQNQLMQDGEDSVEDIERHVEEWISENQEEFDSWIEAAKEAAAQASAE
ncbi:glycine betaine/L-proline ABC transporter substrate-binding protein ProX [Spirulina sp. CS-785/01]|uniref:glycine betaine/L-proline ABC transporter substrate-binding protein ProX n=1 Tax=Spirulina sp. CS-785/01 TaxID=3021716 RepID=UPI00233118EA|nr:glycine betaine/L-proline ABC transporter substrate-binding protein ProX [Spirulina sp. CS-785/01]MDB9312989.1 glycine betaine/L-proline ABC transporter substrate-binding protein ProX [Spirulina sp. CS-785/01]